MEGLRQGAQNMHNGGGGGKGPQRASYYARWKPPSYKPALGQYLAAPPNEEAYLQLSEPVVLIKGAYPDVYARNADGSAAPIQDSEGLHFKAHGYSVFVKPKSGQSFQTFKDLVCSAGPDPHNPQPCLGCYDNDHGNKDAKQKDQWALNLAHLGFYHQHPYMKDGQIAQKKDGSGPIMVKDQCKTYQMENIILQRMAQAGRGQGRQPKACDGCAQQHPFAFGEHRVLQVGRNQLNNLLDLNDQIGKKCATCGTNMLLLYFDCAQCEKHMIDVGSSGYTNVQITEVAGRQAQCGHCGFVGLPRPYNECGFDDRFTKIVGAGCPADMEPVKNTIWDCVLWIQREGEKTDTKIVVKKYELISQFKTPDGRPLADHLKEIVPAPFNLLEMYGPMKLDDQAEMLGKPNPYAAQTPQFQPYGQPSQPPGYGPPQPQGGYAPPGMQPQQPQQGYAPPGFTPPGGRPNFGK